MEKTINTSIKFNFYTVTKQKPLEVYEEILFKKLGICDFKELDNTEITYCVATYKDEIIGLVRRIKEYPYKEEKGYRFKKKYKLQLIIWVNKYFENYGIELELIALLSTPKFF